MRVVALTCSNTEIVCALGMEDVLVGVDDHSDYPVDVVARLPTVGPDLGIDVERVAALQPDLVLASLTVPGHEEVVGNLEAAGLPFLAPEPVSLNDVYSDIERIASALGVPGRGRELVESLESEIVPSPGRQEEPPSILIQWWPNPVIAPGSRSWVHDLVQLAGGTSPLADESIKSRPMTDEEVRAADPDAIVLSWCGVAPEKVSADVVYANETWQELRAIRERHVYRIPEAALGRPSPRLLDGYRELRHVIDRVQAPA